MLLSNKKRPWLDFFLHIFMFKKRIKNILTPCLTGTHIFFNRGFSFQLLQLILRTIVLILQRKYVLVVNIQFFNIWEKRYLCILYLLGDIHFSAYLNFTALAKKVSFPLEVLEILMIFIIATPYNLHPSVYQLYFIVHSRARCDHTCKIIRINLAFRDSNLRRVGWWMIQGFRFFHERIFCCGYHP